MTGQLEPAPIPPTLETGELALPWILAVLLRDRRGILAFAGVGAAISLLATLLRPPYYTSTLSFIPQATEGQQGSGLAALAGQFGLPLGGAAGSSQSPQFYADLLQTREVLLDIATDSFPAGPAASDRVPLFRFLGVSGSDNAVAYENTLRRLREKIILTTVATRTTGLVTVRVRTRSAQVSLAIAERLLKGLNRYNIVTRQSQAAAERRFTEGRLRAAEASLRASEDALQSFLQSNRQLTNSPSLMFQRDRLMREVSLQEQVVSGLTQQNEDARIREVRDTPVIMVIEHPVLAVQADPQGRGRAAILGALASLCLAVTASLIREGWYRQLAWSAAETPSYKMLAQEWQRFRAGLRWK